MVESKHLVPGADSRALSVECPDIYLDDAIMALKFSPTQNVLALSQVTGHLRVYLCSEDDSQEVLVLDHHKESVRSIDFNPEGNMLFAVSADKSFSVVSNGRLEGQLLGAHDEAINCVMHLEDSRIVATGDDDGVVKIWDLRQASQGRKGCVVEFKDHEGTISGMDYAEEHKMLLTAANDGTLGVFDLRKPLLYAMSDSFGDD